MSVTAGLALSPPSLVWEAICRRDFGLTPKEHATLLAIVVFHDLVGMPMPRWELERAAAKPELSGEIDLATPGRLAALGLIDLIGYRERRYYEPTAAGRERALR